MPDAIKVIVLDQQVKRAIACSDIGGVHVGQPEQYSPYTDRGSSLDLGAQSVKGAVSEGPTGNLIVVVDALSHRLNVSQVDETASLGV